ncbi:hypothetical protein D9M70_594170 [compost metagenome]
MLRRLTHQSLGLKPRKRERLGNKRVVFSKAVCTPRTLRALHENARARKEDQRAAGARQAIAKRLQHTGLAIKRHLGGVNGDI